MSNKVVLFDIDYTLFNAKQYREIFLKKIFDEILYPDWNDFLKYTEEAYIENKKVYGFFDPKHFLDILSKKLQKDLPIEKLEKIFSNEEILENSLYQETVQTLKKLKEKDISIGIFSAGKISIQHPKIKQLKKFLDEEHIHVFEFHKSKAIPELMEKYKDQKLYLIDDILDILYNAKMFKEDIVTIWIKRNAYTHQNNLASSYIPDFTITNLEEVIPLIN